MRPPIGGPESEPNKLSEPENKPTDGGAEHILIRRRKFPKAPAKALSGKALEFKWLPEAVGFAIRRPVG